MLIEGKFLIKGNYTYCLLLSVHQNEKYLELVAKFEDLKTAAANAKQTEDSGQWKELTEKIKIMQNGMKICLDYFNTSIFYI